MNNETIADMANREAKRISVEVRTLIEEGYESYNWWSPPIQANDKVRVFGFFTLVKRHEGFGGVHPECENMGNPVVLKKSPWVDLVQWPHDSEGQAVDE